MSIWVPWNEPYVKYLLFVLWSFLWGKMGVQWVWVDSFSSFLIYMLLCFQFTDGKIQEICLPLHKQAARESGEREGSNKARRRKEIFKCSLGYFVQTFGIISPKIKNTKTSTTGLLSLLLSCHPACAHTLELCFRPFSTSKQDAMSNPRTHKANWEAAARLRTWDLLQFC